MKKIGLCYIRSACTVCTVPHWDLYEIDGDEVYNIACMVISNKEFIKSLKKVVKEHNASQKGK